MIQITDGKRTLTVTKSAYETIFKPGGFREVDSINSRKKSRNAIREHSGANGDVSEVVEEVQDESEATVEQTEPSEEEMEVERILSKPISSWNAEELRKVVRVKNIDTKSAKKVQQVKQIVKEALGF